MMSAAPRERVGAHWPEGWREYDRYERDCVCGQPACASNGTGTANLHACSPLCAADAETELRRRIARFAVTCCGCGDLLPAGSSFCATCDDRAEVTAFAGEERRR